MPDNDDSGFYNEIFRETNIPCFVCKQRNGLDCAGRKPNEATRCKDCLDIYMEELNRQQKEHLKKYYLGDDYWDYP